MRIIYNSWHFLRRFPFDTNNPIGYVFAAILQYQVLKYNLLIAANVLPTLIGVFFIAIALTNDIKNDLNSINENAKMEDNRLEMMMKQLCKFIEFHSTLKQFSDLVAMILFPSSYNYIHIKCIQRLFLDFSMIY